MTLTPPQCYEPLSDAALGDIAIYLTHPVLPNARLHIERLLADRDYWRARALAAERRIATRCEWCAGDKDLDQPCKNGCDE